MTGKHRRNREDNVKLAVTNMFFKSLKSIDVHGRDAIPASCEAVLVEIVKTSNLSAVLEIVEKGVNRRFVVMLTEHDS